MGFRDKLYRFMQGRYGSDQFGMFLLGCYVVIMLVGSLIRIPAVYLICNLLNWILMIYMIFRMFSRNIYKRQQENNAFLRRWAPVQRFFHLQKRRIQEGKTSRFYSCPQCKQVIRVPKGKGRIQITCPKCRNTFIKKT